MRPYRVLFINDTARNGGPGRSLQIILQYVDPRVVDLFDDGITVAGGHRSIAPGAPVSRTLERQVLRLLKRA